MAESLKRRLTALKFSANKKRKACNMDVSVNDTNAPWWSVCAVTTKEATPAVTSRADVKSFTTSLYTYRVVTENGSCVAVVRSKEGGEGVADSKDLLRVFAQQLQAPLQQLYENYPARDATDPLKTIVVFTGPDLKTPKNKGTDGKPEPTLMEKLQVYDYYVHNAPADPFEFRRKLLAKLGFTLAPMLTEGQIYEYRCSRMYLCMETEHTQGVVPEMYLYRPPRCDFYVLSHVALKPTTKKMDLTRPITEKNAVNGTTLSLLHTKMSPEERKEWDDSNAATESPASYGRALKVLDATRERLLKDNPSGYIHHDVDVLVGVLSSSCPGAEPDFSPVATIRYETLCKELSKYGLDFHKAIQYTEENIVKLPRCQKYIALYTLPDDAQLLVQVLKAIKPKPNATTKEPSLDKKDIGRIMPLDGNRRLVSVCGSSVEINSTATIGQLEYELNKRKELAVMETMRMCKNGHAGTSNTDDEDTSDVDESDDE